MPVDITGNGPNITATGEGTAITLTVTTGSGGGAPTGGAGGFLSGTYPNPGVNTEALQDAVGAMAGTGLTYDDTAGVINATAGSVDSDDVAGPIRAFVRVPVPVSALGGTVSSGVATIAALNTVPSGGIIWLVGQTSSADDGFYAKTATNTFTETTDYLSGVDHVARLIVVGADIGLRYAQTVYTIGNNGVATSAQLVSVLPYDMLRLRAMRQEHADELAAGITRVFRFNGAASGRWSTPNLTAQFTTGIAVRSLRIPRRPATVPWFAEILTQAHDAGVGSWDNFEKADLWPDDTFGADVGDTPTAVLENQPRAFWEQTESGGTTDGSSWWPDLLLAADQPIETLVDITFSNSTGRMWLRVPYALDDGGTYWTDPDDDAVFRLMSTRVSSKFASIDAHTEEWWLGQNYSGDIVRVKVRNGRDGALVANPDASLVAPGSRSFTDGDGNVWTGGAAAQVVDLAAPSAAQFVSGSIYSNPNVTVGGTREIRASRATATPIFIPVAVTIDALQVDLSAVVADATPIDLHLFASVAGYPSGAPVASASVTTSGTAAQVLLGATAAPVEVPAGIYWAVIHNRAAATNHVTARSVSATQHLEPMPWSGGTTQTSCYLTNASAVGTSAITAFPAVGSVTAQNAGPLVGFRVD